MPFDVPAAAQIPPYLTPSEVGNACQISRRKAKSLLRGAGILERIGERWYVGESRLRERLPDVYDRVYEAFVLRGDTEVRDAV
jgi:hypothetical protein